MNIICVDGIASKLVLKQFRTKRKTIITESVEFVESCAGGGVDRGGATSAAVLATRRTSELSQK